MMPALAWALPLAGPMPSPPSAPSRPLPLTDSLSREFPLHHRRGPLTVNQSGTIAVVAGLVAAGFDDIAIAHSKRVARREVTDAELTAHIERLTRPPSTR